MKAGADIISQLGQKEISEIEKSGGYQLMLNGQTYDLSLEDFVIGSDDIEGWMVAKDEEITVALDIHLDHDLVSEGIARELVNRIQNMRKEADFEVTDRIQVRISPNEIVFPAVEKFGEYIRQEVLADELSVGPAENGQEVELVEGARIRITLHRN